MAQTFTRLELYELVWSEPMRTAASRFSISDVALAKACRKAHIPVPPRGYWARKQAGHKVIAIPLPPREPGHSDQITLARGHSWRQPTPPFDENAPEPPTPVFDELIEMIRERIEKRVSNVRVSPTFDVAHPGVQTLLAKDQERREKQRRSKYISSWDTPIFDAPLQLRRLRIFNAIFLALTEQGHTAYFRRDKVDEPTVRIGVRCIELGLEHLPDKRTTHSEEKNKGRLKLCAKSYPHSTVLAQDERGKPIEMRLRKIVVDLIMLGEDWYRKGLIDHHKWQLDHRAWRIREAQRVKEEAEHKERERIAALEQARVDRLLSEAASLQRATEIRGYVAAVKRGCAENPTLLDKLAVWENWALAQADRIDPITSGSFLANPELAPREATP